MVDGALAPTSELDLHLGVYERFGAGARRPHPRADGDRAVAACSTSCRCVHYEMLLLGGPVRVAPYATFGTPELAAAVLDALEGRTAALMANHGAITYGADLAGALARDRAARVGVHGLLARRRDRHAARARRGGARRRSSTPRVAARLRDEPRAGGAR